MTAPGMEAKLLLQRLFCENISVPAKRSRSLNPDVVVRMADSFQRLGQRTPISVREDGDDIILVAGLHRLEAAKRLGWEKIDAVYVAGDEHEARLWEIAENLHRADLTAIERAQHVAEWVRLTEDKLAQPAPVSGGRGNQGGVRAASRELGMDRDDVRRSVKIAGLSDEAKAAARETGLDDNRAALLAAAAKPTPHEQAETVRDWASTRSRTRTPEPEPPDDDGDIDDEVAALVTLWTRTSQPARDEFLIRVGAA